jgi:hypothetical protein
MKLPELRPDPSWNKEWLFDLPLCTTLVNLTADTRKASTIPLKYIAADIIINSDKVLDILFSGLDGQSQNVVISTMRDMANKDIVWAPWMKIAKQYHNTGQKSDEILPNCRHWIVTNDQNKPIELAQVTLKVIRQYWHKDKLWFGQPPKPPLKIPPTWRITSSKWKSFWTLPIEHKAFTPWWRLLQDCIGTRRKLANWNTEKFGNATCMICHQQDEDTLHFAVSCPIKWKVWKESLHAHEDMEQVTAVEDVWEILMLGKPNKNIAKKAVYLGFVFVRIWRYHWICVREESTWRHEVIMNMIQNQEIE